MAGRKPKLTPLEKRDVYLMYLEGKSVLELQIKYQVSESTILRIIREQKDL